MKIQKSFAWRRRRRIY